jgi:hypothetical protein
MTWTRLYDPARTPDHWTQIISQGEYAVFILAAGNRMPRDREGRPFSSGGESVAICADFDDAVDFADTIVARHPELCAEIYDHEGKSGEPLRVVYEPSVRGKYEGRPYAKRETAWGLAIISCGIAFVIFDVRQSLAWMWGYIIGAKLIIIGGSFLIRGLIGLYAHPPEPTPSDQMHRDGSATSPRMPKDSSPNHRLVF